ncbi:HAD-IA family hydrolase [Pseudohongiella acticola]|uniref:HAD-IA family hydrolase n=1 Tax=Pseudohongiella acticola TaxID=1524254 RepID=UPI003C6E81C7
MEILLSNLDIPFCVASSGSHQKMRTTLGRTGLLRHVEGRLFSTSDVGRGKPFPDIYLHAAREMGTPASRRCLVVEDSPTGVEGAIKGGDDCIWIR